MSRVKRGRVQGGVLSTVDGGKSLEPGDIARDASVDGEGSQSLCLRAL